MVLNSQCVLRTTSLIGLLSLICCLANASDMVVTYPGAQSKLDPRQAYFVSVLEQALEATEDAFGNYTLNEHTQYLPPSRIPMLIRQQQIINIMSSPVTEQLNASMQPVPFPLLMGIQGMRVAMVHNDNSQLLADVKTLQDLKPITFGHGLGWVDALIFQDAQLRIGTAVNYESLFGMLANKRIDAFTRGVNEVWPELRRFSAIHPDLVIDEHALFYYPLPVYFYVSKDNNVLASRVLAGLKMIAATGQFQQSFDELFSAELTALKLEQRQIIVLENHYLPDRVKTEIAPYLHPLIKQKLTLNVASDPIDLSSD